MSRRIESGSVKPNMPFKVLGPDGSLVEQGRISKVLAFRGLERVPVEQADAGDIVAIAGLVKGTVADTFCAPEVETPLRAQPIDPPTVSMTFLVNDSPLAGTEGDKVTSRMIRDRLFKEAEGNVALKVEESAGTDVRRPRPRRIAAASSSRPCAARSRFGAAVARGDDTRPGRQCSNRWKRWWADVDERSGIVVQKMSERRLRLSIRALGRHRLLSSSMP
jgi:GTP-binding protein